MKFCEEYYLAMAEADRWADELAAVEAARELKSLESPQAAKKPPPSRAAA